MAYASSQVNDRPDASRRRWSTNSAPGVPVPVASSTNTASDASHRAVHPAHTRDRDGRDDGGDENRGQGPPEDRAHGHADREHEVNPRREHDPRARQSREALEESVLGSIAAISRSSASPAMRPSTNTATSTGTSRARNQRTRDGASAPGEPPGPRSSSRATSGGPAHQPEHERHHEQEALDRLGTARPAARRTRRPIACRQAGRHPSDRRPPRTRSRRASRPRRRRPRRGPRAASRTPAARTVGGGTRGRTSQRAAANAVMPPPPPLGPARQSGVGPAAPPRGARGPPPRASPAGPAPQAPATRASGRPSESGNRPTSRPASTGPSPSTTRWPARAASIERSRRHRPPPRTSSRSQACSMSVMTCELSSAVAPVSWTASTSTWRNSRRASGSSEASGSSSSSTGARVPERDREPHLRLLPAGQLVRARIERDVELRRGVALRSPDRMPAATAPRATRWSATDSSRYSDAAWGTYPIRRSDPPRSRHGSIPSTSSRPAVGRSNPTQPLIRVDFPAPFGPTSAVIEPVGDGSGRDPAAPSGRRRRYRLPIRAPRAPSAGPHAVLRAMEQPGWPTAGRAGVGCRTAFRDLP